MTPDTDELVKSLGEMADAYARDGDHPRTTVLFRRAAAALARVTLERDEALSRVAQERDEAREACAKVADEVARERPVDARTQYYIGGKDAAREIAAAIRALTPEKPNE